MRELAPDMTWYPHRGVAQKLRQRTQYIRPLIKSKDPEVVKVREWLRALSEDEEEFHVLLAKTWHASQEEGISWIDAVTEMVGDVS